MQQLGVVIAFCLTNQTKEMNLANNMRIICQKSCKKKDKKKYQNSPIVNKIYQISPIRINFVEILTNAYKRIGENKPLVNRFWMGSQNIKMGKYKIYRMSPKRTNVLCIKQAFQHPILKKRKKHCIKIPSIK